MQYSTKLLHYFHDTQHAEQLDREEPHVYCAEAGSEAQGYMLVFYLRCANGVIEQATFQACGSAVMIAACEYICRHIEYKTLVEAGQVTIADIQQALATTSLQTPALLVIERLLHQVITQGKENG